MNKMFIILFAVSILMASVQADNSERPETPVVKLKNCRKPPLIDGKLNDECWKNAYQSPCFYDFALKCENYHMFTRVS